MISRITNLFPLWAILLSGTAYLYPEIFAGQKAHIVPLLSVIMFGMGMTLTWANFRAIFQQPGIIALGLLLQFSVMPLAAFVISRLLVLSEALTAGMVLVGASPGGTASNVICFLAGGNVALSITLTLCSTALAIFATPALTWLYVGQTVPVPVVSMLLSIAKIVILPVLAGTIVNSLFGDRLKRIRPVFPLLSVAAIVGIIAIIVGWNHDNIAEIGSTLVLAVVLHNMVGLTSGYAIAKLFRKDEQVCRTIAIEVGMQNSGLGVTLAAQYFNAVAALPGAIFSIWHNLSGALLASSWGKKPFEEITSDATLHP
jgi:BASS family bile acid:Na+ symporter